MKKNDLRKSKQTYEVPLEVTPEAARDFGIDPSKVRWKLIGNKKFRVVPILATKEVYDEYMRPIWSELKREARERRCVVPGKGGRLIRCPDSRSCTSCPHYQRINLEDNRPSSVEQMVLQGKEPSVAGAFEDMVADFALLDVLVKRLAEIDPEYVEILRLLIDEIPQSTIAELLHMKPRTLSDRVKRIRKIAWSIFYEE